MSDVTVNVTQCCTSPWAKNVCFLTKKHLFCAPDLRFCQSQGGNLGSCDFYMYGISFVVPGHHARAWTEVRWHNTKWPLLHDFCLFLCITPYFSPQRSDLINLKTLVPLNIFSKYIFQVSVPHLRIPCQCGAHCETRCASQNDFSRNFLYKYAYICPLNSVLDNSKCKLLQFDCLKKPGAVWMVKIGLLEGRLL